MKKLLVAVTMITLAACGAGVSTEVKTDSTHIDSLKVDSVKVDSVK